METTIVATTVQDRKSIFGTLELIEVSTEDGTEYNVTFSMDFPGPELQKLNGRHNVGCIKKKEDAKKFYSKQMRKLIEEGTFNYFYDLVTGTI